MLKRWIGRRVVAAVLCLLGFAGTAVVRPGTDHERSSDLEAVGVAAAASASDPSTRPDTAGKTVETGKKATTTTTDPTTTSVAPPTTEADAAAAELRAAGRKRGGGSTTTTAPGTTSAPEAPQTDSSTPPPPPPAPTQPPSKNGNDLPGPLADRAWSARDLLRSNVSLGLPPGWGLDYFAPELQRYRDKGVTFRPDGLISLDALSGDPDSPTGYTSGAFTSGWLSSQQKIHRGDYVQAAMKLPGGSGMWPALWLLDVPTPDRSQTHEVDIMEAVGREPGIVYHTIHFNGQQTQLSTKLDYTQWHTYGVYLGDDATYFYVDGVLRGTTDAAPAAIEYGVMANLALGGSWAGEPDPANFPAQVLMTPVRVWTPA
jgi:beta-glucanase (GH16 family)